MAQLQCIDPWDLELPRRYYSV